MSFHWFFSGTELGMECHGVGTESGMTSPFKISTKSFYEGRWWVQGVGSGMTPLGPRPGVSREGRDRSLMVWLQSGIWVEMIPPCKSLFSTWDPPLLFCLQFLFSHPREEGAVPAGRGRDEGL